MSGDEGIEDVLEGLRREKQMIEMVKEMGRRVGMHPSEAHLHLARERRSARLENRPADMKRVAWAIHNAAERKE